MINNVKIEICKYKNVANENGNKKCFYGPNVLVCQVLDLGFYGIWIGL